MSCVDGVVDESSVEACSAHDVGGLKEQSRP